ncbi:MAG TPA: hypothetical protein VLI04_08805, partial [Nocardioidaceae bacterium]|nr:hypothetical protein [Nocardioidaceae bacterium]
MNKPIRRALSAVAASALTLNIAGAALAADDTVVIQTPDAAGFATPNTVTFAELCVGQSATA